MSDNLPCVVSQVLKLYNMSVDSGFANTLKSLKGYLGIVKVDVTFKPKEYNSITPGPVYIGARVQYHEDYYTIYHMDYLTGEDMPILPYLDDYNSLEKFLEGVVLEESNKKFKSLGFKELPPYSG